jgi:hypothetical protein
VAKGMITETHPKRTMVEETIDAFFILNELAGLADKFHYKPKVERASVNSFKHTYCIRKYIRENRFSFQMKTIIRFKHNMLTKEIIAEIDEKAFKLNTSRYAPLKNYKRKVTFDGKQGERFIEVSIDSPDHLQQFLIDMQPAIYDHER